MKDNTAIQTAIIGAATALILQSNGDIKKITSRAIAEKANVALGLINYHFESKEKLIALCVQRIINQVLMNFSPDKKDYSEDDGLTDKQRLSAWAQQTFDFLFGNYSIARISILSDFGNYEPRSNAAITQMGFALAIRENIPESRKRLIAFSLTSTMQTAFLTGENSKAITGYDLSEKAERDLFIEDIVSLLMGGSL